MLFLLFVLAKQVFNYKKKVDSILTPMLSSVQSFQTTIKNAPDNVMGMVKGISDNLLPNNLTGSSSNSSGIATGNASSSVNSSLSNQSGPSAGNSSIRHSTSSNQIHHAASSANMNPTIMSSSSKGVNQIERTILNGDDLVNFSF